MCVGGNKKIQARSQEQVFRLICPSAFGDWAGVIKARGPRADKKFCTTSFHQPMLGILTRSIVLSDSDRGGFMSAGSWGRAQQGVCPRANAAIAQ